MLSLNKISKSFGAVNALTTASLNLMPGEIRAFLGANGSGKSTMVKILSGLVRMDTGEIKVDDENVTIHSPQDSRSIGVAAAYQDLSLIPRLTVAENIMLGHEPVSRLLINNNSVLESAKLYLDELGAYFPLDTLVMDLDSSSLSLVEIAKALSWSPRFLLLDEVTASLHKDQVDKVFSLLRRSRDKGMAVLFVSHRLDEVFKLCDTASILRGGINVANVKTEDVDEADLVFYMTGMKIDEILKGPPSTRHHTGERPLIETVNLVVDPKVNGVNFRSWPGEIVGIGGLQGQGQEDFLRALYGFLPIDGGKVIFEGQETRFRSPADATRVGFGFIPGDREREGIFPIRPISDNISMAEFGKQRLFELVHPQNLLAVAKDIVTQLGIKIGRVEDPALSLSGGNQQKLVVGRWLKVAPRVLLLDDPTKGVDVTSRREIHELLRSMAADGTTIIISSSDNDELLELADRILIFYEGRVVRELVGEEIAEDAMVAAMLGVGLSELKEENT